MTENNNSSQFSRRNVLQFGAGILGATSLTAWLGKGALAQNLDKDSTVGSAGQLLADNHPSTGSTRPTPDEAIAQLVAGNQRFVDKKRISPNQDFARLTAVAQGQNPFAAILSCADSRVVPEIVFDQGIGDLFVVRVAGNVASIEDIASEEYGVGVLGVSVLLVLGHERCGAVDASIKGGSLPGMIESLVLAIKPAVEASKNQPGDALTNAIKMNVKMQMERLKVSPVITDALNAGTLKIIGGYYDLDTGAVTLIA